MPSITQLEYLLAVHRHKHFGRAAAECHVSQPSLSAQVQKVEDELGIVIFDRSKKPILTTDKGLKIIEQAKEVLRQHQSIYLIATDEGQLRGSFHLGIIPTLAAYVLPLFVESFSRKYPEIQLKISEYKTQDIVRALQDDELDAGLLVTPLYNETLVERVLFYEDFYLFVSEGHPLHKRKFVNENDLDERSIWLLEEGHCFRDQVLKVCSLRADKPVLPNVQFESGNLETLMNLIRGGRGYTLLPHLATQNLHKKEKLTQLKRFNKPVPSREVSLVTSRSFMKAEVVEALEAEIISSLPPELRSLKKDQKQVVDM